MKNLKILFLFLIISACSNDDDYVTSSYKPSGDLIIDVSASGNGDYILNGNDGNGSVTGNDPSISFTVGDDITFQVMASGHPFYLKTKQGVGTGNLIPGVNNNGSTNGNITWKPSSPGTYYYQCSVHNSMNGVITIVDSYD